LNQTAGQGCLLLVLQSEARVFGNSRHFAFRRFFTHHLRNRHPVSIIACVRKVAVHLCYGTQVWLSVSKLSLNCAVVSLYLVVKQRLKCNTGKVCNCLIQFLLTMVLTVEERVFISSQRLSECTVPFCI
jgi:hypothetical protein